MIIKQDIRIVQIKTLKIYHNKGTLPRYQFDPEAISGFDDTADIRRDTAPRPWTDGDFEEQGRFGSKVITLTGIAVARNPRELHDMRDRLAGVLAHGEYTNVAFSNASMTRYMRVGLGSSISWITVTDTWAKFKIDLYAPDPYQYGITKTTQITSAGTNGAGLNFPMTYGKGLSFGVITKKQNVTVKNLGNHRAWPTFTIRGDYSNGFKIRSGTSTVSYNGPSRHSAPVVVNMSRGIATVNGSDMSHLLEDREWISIAAGGSIQPIFTPTQEGDGWMDVTWRDTWV